MIRHSIYILFSVNLLLLGGCGIKPANVQPPEHVEKDTFPQIYPDISLDLHPKNSN